jgi:alanine-glyoxylate transaminase / serine-glyoxylate transaminase / serine-pyruvate transaminase
MSPRLMIPGPVEVSPTVLGKLAEPVHAHYGAEWTAIHNETLGLVRQVMGTSSNKVFLMPGSGNSGNEAGLGGMLREGEKAIVGMSGMFGNRLAEIARSYGAEVIDVKADPGTPLYADAFAQALKRHPDASLVAVVHLETSTGVLNPVRNIAEVCHAAGVPILIDAVSSLAGTELPVDEWGIDVCASATQKCLSTPPGLAVVSVAEKAWPRIERPGTRGWYYNLNVWQHYAVAWADWHPFPLTMPTNIVLGFREALRQLVAEGVENRIAKYRRLAKRLRSGLVELGMNPIVGEDYSAPVLTAFWVPAGTTSTQIMDFILKECDIQISRGFDTLRDTVCRVGHMGSEIDEELIDALLAGLREFDRKRPRPA